MTMNASYIPLNAPFNPPLVTHSHNRQLDQKIKPIVRLDLCELPDLEGELACQALALYEASFPPAERQPVAQLAADLRQRVGSGWIHHFWVLVAEETVWGLAIFNYYRDSRLGCLKYLAIRPDLQGQGHGSYLFQCILSQIWQDAAWMGGAPPLGLCFEVEQPEAALSDLECARRQRRIRFYQRQGAYLLEQVNYVAPPSAEDLPAMALHLMFRPSPERQVRLTQAELAAIVKAILQQGYGLELDHPFFRRAVAVMGSKKGAHYHPIHDQFASKFTFLSR